METTFANSERMHPGWRLLLYVLLIVAIGAGSMVLLDAVFQPPYTLTAKGLLIHELWSFGVLMSAALIMARIEHRSPGSYGLPLSGPFLRRLGQGTLLGLGEISLLVGLIAAFGGYSFGPLALHGGEILRWGGIWLLVFFAVGLFEEFAFRGYTQFTLGEGIGFWPAAVVLSAAFGAVHLRNGGENWVGAAGVFLVGMVFALTLKRTGSLWLAVGMHTSFDFGETFLYSVPNSGVQFQGHLSKAALWGDKGWLTGGSVGPEASVFGFMTLLLLALVIHWLFPPSTRTVSGGAVTAAESVNQI